MQRKDFVQVLYRFLQFLKTLVLITIPLEKNKFSRKSTCYISDKTKEKWPQMKCSNGIKNQDETGVDCGGPCKQCGKINYVLNERNIRSIKLIFINEE